MTEYVPPHVISVLKTYQDKAPRSLHGPGLSLVHPSKTSSAIVVGREETPDLHGGTSQHHHPLHHSAHGGEHGAGGGRAGSDEEVTQSRQHQPMGPPVPGVPIMTTPDPDCGIVQMTILEGKRIGCFLLGGETRLCLPQIFNNILMDFSVEQINRSIQELMIYLYNCTDQQLAEFKRANIIPDTAKTCGLITRTNAERLCSSLLHQAHELRPRLKNGGASGLMNGSFRVYHRCFGKGEGLFLPELYSYEEPFCIECAECRGLFSPQKFVCHQHEPQEIRTCHWGFNSSNWRSYIHVAESEKNREEHAQVLDKIWLKEREIEQELECERAFWIARRKAAFEDGGPIAIKAEPLDIPLKKPKLMSDVASLYHCSNNSSSSSSGSSRAQHYAAQQQLLVHPQSHLLHHHQQQQQTSAAFRPWTAQQKAQKYAQQQQQALLLQQIGPYANGTTTTIVNGTIRPTSPGGSILTLSQEPPLLQNPENVVPMSETDKFERSYQPNVALVPRKSILCGKEPSSVSVTPVQRRDYEGKDRSVIKCEVVQIKQESPATPPASATGGSPSADGTMRSVIKCDVQIKQERPGTPPTTGSGHLDHGGRGGRGDNSRSPGPPSSAHIPVSPPPPAGTSQKHALAQGAIAISTIIAKQQQPHHQLVSSMASYGGSNSNSPVPIPLDVPHSGSSGSNEITSSTSPLPPSSIVVNMNGTEGVVLGGEVGDKPKLVLIKEPISPSLSSRTPTGRHSPHGHMLQQQSGGSGHHSQSVSSPPPSHHSELHQPLYLHHHQVLQQQQQQQQQLFRSHLPGTTSTTTGGTIIHRNGHPIVGNSEFELSTDTDDDSQMGEPDSSNVPTTMELIGEMLKEVEPETKQQILNIFKVLLQESRVEHHRLQMEIRAKEDQLMEMQRHKMELQRQTDHFQQQIHQLQHELDRALLKIESLREHQHPLSQQHQQQQHHIMVRDTMGRVGESSTSSTPPSPLSLVSNGSNSNHSHQLIERRNSFPEKSEIIMKPLKKLLRRSPEDASTVLMLASPPSQSTGSLPPSLPACLSITATTVSVTPKASSTQADTEARREEGRRQHHSSISVSASQMVGGGVGGGGVLQSSPPPAPSQPQPISATNVPASPTTITAVSTVNGSVAATIAGTSTAPSITKPSSTVENGPSPSPIVVVIPVSSSVPLPNDAASSSSTPPSRAVTPVSPRCDARGRRTPADGKDNGDDCDEDEPMDEPAHALDSPTTADVKSDTSLEGMAKASITVTKGSAVGTVTSSSTSSGGASNQENDSPNRSKGESTSGNCTKNSCDN